MSCKFDKYIIQKYIDNSIDPLELIVLREHLAVCQDCKQELELMSKLEDSMYNYFGSIPNNDLLDEFSMNVLESCYVESDKNKLINVLSKAWDMNKLVARNASSYAKYLPGRKYIVKTAKKASASLNKAAKSYIKSSLKKVISSTVK
jgi:hypothetical protein